VLLMVHLYTLLALTGFDRRKIKTTGSTCVRFIRIGGEDAVACEPGCLQVASHTSIMCPRTKHTQVQKNFISEGMLPSFLDMVIWVRNICFFQQAHPA
jgi:hypothetical protein